MAKLDGNYSYSMSLTLLQQGSEVLNAGKSDISPPVGQPGWTGHRNGGLSLIISLLFLLLLLILICSDSWETCSFPAFFNSDSGAAEKFIL